MSYYLFPPPLVSQAVYVSKGGAGVSAPDGSQFRPFPTIPAAMASITDASPTKRYGIVVGPGVFNESFSLKANVHVVGLDPMLTRIGGAVDLNDVSWTPAGNHQSGFQNVSFVGTAPVFDFTLNGGSNEGKIFLWDCRCNGTMIFTAFSSINQGTLHDCFFFAGYTQTGMNLSFIACGFINGGSITVNSVNTGNIPAVATFFGGGSDGNLSLLWTAGGGGSHPVLAQFRDFGWDSSSVMTIDGAQASVTGTADAIPPTVTLLNSAPSPTLVTRGHAIGYTPTTPADWVAPVPTTIQQAIDRMASLLAVLNGSPIP